jgi:hypothetical protein
MNEAKPKRRWFRFSLRTLFVLVTIVGIAAGWVRYQTNWVQQRREFLNALAAERDAGDEQFNRVGAMELPPAEPNPIPFVRKILGDRPYFDVVLPERYGQDLIDRANGLFPEALILWYGGHSHDPLTGEETSFIIDVTNHYNKYAAELHLPTTAIQSRK